MWLLLVLALQPPAEYQRGMALAARGDLEGAVAPLSAACSQNPNLEDACYFHGRNLFVLGRYEEAIGPLGKALRAAAPNSRWRVHRAIAMNFQALNRATEAERHYIEALNGSDDSGLRVDYGAFLFRLGRTREALIPLEAAVRSSASARAHGELGRVLFHAGRFTDAALHLESAVSMVPKEWTYRLMLGKAYLQLGRTDEGQRELEAARQGLAGSSNSK